ncbi:bifunctional anthranilate synthase component I family protein/class IV aminotransferase [Undibacterium sp. Jales W-56]|uniref:bifunctional anthranilate synthase component I family protein/class IV aminotransferase n=1 Tax=Undibacterium sp. Jales W-56 TaxID=2897325 RepID=UPI0021CF02AC|nr:bifunctional anthranilate synthase component I family protein/class IV aminotransferase [Undibacterium sp. Jales W-56]MCU6434963.1 bifunctional anthranilate synthase component I family protein/class IV aminotransferase [Undibacterium sp. Jales W-56]
MSFLPHKLPDSFALLDDAQSPDGQAASRLYTGLVKVLQCDDAPAWPRLWQALEAALQGGQYAVALLSYETGALLQDIASWDAQQLPSRVLLFSHCEVLDREQVNLWLDTSANALEQAASAPGSMGADAAGIAGIAGLRNSVDEAAFTQAIAQVRAYIAAGDTYQVNYTYRLHFDVYGSPLHLYRRLRQRQPVPYGALICLPDGEAVLSLSPELFVRHQAGHLHAKPMKGTAAATGDQRMDAELARSLAADVKNRAENLMIVDLLRNDLGRLAVPGSVKVPALFEVRRFSSVLQMTSSITAELRAGLGLASILSALYPCGSITGAPKRRTMQIVRELESEPRGLYTGAIGWFDPPQDAQAIGDFCLSVPIRTLHLPASEGLPVRPAVMGVGAGIVHDSVAADEFAECRLKAQFLTGLGPEFDLFETMHATREHGCRHLQRHLQRLRHSARYFGFVFDEEAIAQSLRAFQADLPPQGAHRLRLALRVDGQVLIQSAAMHPLAARVKVLLASISTHSDDLFLRHKTTVRQRYDQAWQAAEQQGAFDMLFCNQHGYLTEGARTNVFILKQGRWLTPPLTDGVLPGIMRAVLLDDPQWRASEAQLRFDDVRAAEAIILCNSLRGVMHADLVF